MTFERGRDIGMKINPTGAGDELKKGLDRLSEGDKKSLKLIDDSYKANLSQLQSRKKDFNDWVDKFPDLKESLSIQKMLFMLDYLDMLILNLIKKDEFLEKLLSDSLLKIDELKRDKC